MRMLRLRAMARTKARPPSPRAEPPLSDRSRLAYGTGAGKVGVRRWLDDTAMWSAELPGPDLDGGTVRWVAPKETPLGSYPSRNREDGHRPRAPRNMFSSARRAERGVSASRFPQSRATTRTSTSSTRRRRRRSCVVYGDLDPSSPSTGGAPRRAGPARAPPPVGHASPHVDRARPESTPKRDCPGHRRPGSQPRGESLGRHRVGDEPRESRATSTPWTTSASTSPTGKCGRDASSRPGAPATLGSWRRCTSPRAPSTARSVRS